MSRRTSAGRRSAARGMRTVVIRPDGSQIITVVGRDGQLMRRIRRDPMGREIIIIDNSYRDPRAFGGFYVDLPPPMIYASLRTATSSRPTTPRPS